jgi:hypothetical protein
MKFYVKLGKNARDTCALLSEAYEGEAVKKSNVFEWHKWFKEGSENVEDEMWWSRSSQNRCKC